MRQVYIKLLTEPVMMNLLSRTQRKVYYTRIREITKATITSVGLGPRTIQVANLPTKFTNDNILTARKGYGATRGIKYDAWTHLYLYRVGNGIRIVQIDLVKHIPSQLTLGISCFDTTQWRTGKKLQMWRQRTQVARLSGQDRTTGDDAEPSTRARSAQFTVFCVVMLFRPTWNE